MRQIDADELIDELSLVYDIREAEDDPYNIGVMAAIAKVKQMPTIEPKLGKWEDVEADEGEWICFKCSECGHDAYSYSGEILSNEWKFCPYCGAKMDGMEQKGEIK